MRAFVCGRKEKVWRTWRERLWRKKRSLRISRSSRSDVGTVSSRRFIGGWLTGKPEPTYTCGPSISWERPMGQKPFHAPTSVITCDMQGIVQEYAADAAELFGWTPYEVIGKMSVAMFHVPRNVPTLVPRLLREAVEKGKFEEEVTLMRKDGSTFRAVLTVRPIVREGHHMGFMGMTHPLTPPGPVPVARLWVQALRAPFIVASLIPGFVGVLAARQAGYGINLGLLGLSLLGLGFIHLGTNMTNAAWDYRGGTDLEVRHLDPFARRGQVPFGAVRKLRTHLG